MADVSVYNAYEKQITDFFSAERKGTKKALRSFVEGKLGMFSSII